MYQTRPYLEQRELWPPAGRHILADFDDDHVVVYQAYRPEIADWAIENQQFGGPWSFDRMSWIKPNFLWMMYRSDWARTPGQERILAITVRRLAFLTILSRAVQSSFSPTLFSDQTAWKQAMKASDVRLQWDPDHDPYGGKVARRAVQLGMRGETLRSFATTWTTRIDDITDFVNQQKGNLDKGGLPALQTPIERVLEIPAPLAARLGIAG